ncbi:MAG: SUMF1/EgtB/PvdO family nonheme iron enzyme [Candidatus Sumerlaeota bacterium]|nr:SUMF1/EgtB/PvdO family nonheme iron enzyme [Candidatus Sumerlaeota bacterium]
MRLLMLKSPVAMGAFLFAAAAVFAQPSTRPPTKQNNAAAANVVKIRSDSYITTAANGDGIPYPASKNTYTVRDGARAIQVPKGMVYIPAGNFTSGTGASAQTAYLDGYCIGKFLVTNAEYKAFLDATDATGYPEYWPEDVYPAGKANHPVLYISLTDALAYCAWVSVNTGWNVTIPSSAHLEKAARGPNAYLYPWGATQDTSYSGGVLTSKFSYNGVCAAYYLKNFPNMTVTYSNANSPYYATTTTVSQIAAYNTSGTPTYLSISSSGAIRGWVDHNTWTGFIYTDLFDALNAVGGYTAAVGSYANGVSAYGCYDMAGNAWEWTTTPIIATNGAEAGKLVNEIRGGSWYANGTSCRCIGLGEGRSAAGAYNTVGFRIVMLPAAPPLKKAIR